MSEGKEKAGVKQSSKITDLLREAGVCDLNRKSTPEEVLDALQKLSRQCGPLTKPQRLLLRGQAAKQLKEIGVGKASELVDSVLDRADQRATANQEQGVSFVACDPWPEAVDGAALLDAIVDFIEKHMVLEAGAAVIIALWAVYTHIFDVFDTAPILLATSPVKRCGKTRLLSIISHLVHRAFAVSGISPAALFRSIEAFRPTLLLDEGDTVLRGRNEELRQVFNASHTRTGAFIVRCVGDDHQPRPFSVWAPKFIAMIGLPADTIVDRSILVRMRRKFKGETVEAIRPSRLKGQLEPLARMAARWTADNEELLKSSDPDVPAELHDRAADNWVPLLAIADAVGGEWPIRAREAALATAAAADHGLAAEVQLLLDVRELFEESRANRFSSQEMVEHLIQMEDRPWPEWRNGQPLTKAQMADVLKPFGITPKKMRFGFDTARGYEMADFEEAFSRYLPPPEQAEQPEQRDLFNIEEPEKEDEVA